MDASLQARAEQLATEFAGQATTAEELQGLLRLMMKSGLERMLNSELDVHLGRRKTAASDEESSGQSNVSSRAADGKKRAPNRRNGRSRKRVQGDLGEVTIATFAWFFAVARTIDGPPMSISSINSSTVMPGRSRAAANG